MKNLILILTVIFPLTILSGCATIFSGSREEIDLSSDPPGAEVIVNGEEEGTTPMLFDAKKGREYKIEFNKEGYEKKIFKLMYGISAGWLILDIFSGIIGVAVDASTGNWNGFDVDNYKAVLVKK